MSEWRSRLIRHHAYDKTTGKGVVVCDTVGQGREKEESTKQERAKPNNDEMEREMFGRRRRLFRLLPRINKIRLKQKGPVGSEVSWGNSPNNFRHGDLSGTLR